jgi:hypothetical protein
MAKPNGGFHVEAVLVRLKVVRQYHKGIPAFSGLVAARNFSTLYLRSSVRSNVISVR